MPLLHVRRMTGASIRTITSDRRGARRKVTVIWVVALTTCAMTPVHAWLPIAMFAAFLGFACLDEDDTSG